jgi:hypothetical protein
MDCSHPAFIVMKMRKGQTRVFTRLVPEQTAPVNKIALPAV